MAIQKPTMGRMVRFVDSDGDISAAMVIGVDENDEHYHVALAVFSSIMHKPVCYRAACDYADYSTGLWMPNSWHWPEFASKGVGI